jgi:hypothetical protein
LNPTSDLVPVHIGQVDVEKDQIGLRGDGLRQATGTCVGARNFMPIQGEHQCSSLGRGGMVIYNQHSEAR